MPYSAHLYPFVRPFIFGLLGAISASADLPFTEEFDTDTHKDGTTTTADWALQQEEARLAPARYRYLRASLFTEKTISTENKVTNAVVAGDVDGDGDIDAIAGDNQGPHLYLNNGTDDPFNGVSSVVIGNSTQNVVALALGDVDADGDLDLLVGFWSVRCQLFLNNGTSDPFAGVSGVLVADGLPSVNKIALADMDGDGDPDLVAASHNTVNSCRIYLNRGPVRPFQGVTGLIVPDSGNGSHAIAVGDLDDDGDFDLVTSSYSGAATIVHLNNGTADPFAGVSGTTLTSSKVETLDIALGDMNGDGRLDIVAGSKFNGVWLYANNATSAPFDGVEPQQIGDESNKCLCLASGDLDGDGDLDLATGYETSDRFFLNNGTGEPFGSGNGTVLKSHFATEISRGMTLADFDGNSDLDIATAKSQTVNTLYINGSLPGIFGEVGCLDISTQTNPSQAVAVGDVDGDGDLDAVIANYGTPNRLYRAKKTANPFNGVAGADIGTDSHDTRAVALGDLDGDGDLDLVAGNSGQMNRLYLNNGTSTPFSDPGIDITTDSHHTWDIKLGDVNRNGHLDIIAANASSEVNRFYPNNGTADPFKGVTGADITTDAYNTRAIALADMNGDGRLDVVTANNDQRNRLYLHDGAGAPFNATVGTDIGGAEYHTSDVAVSDVDHDGDLDVFFADDPEYNLLFINQDTADPFAGVSGIRITNDRHSSRGIAAVDIDRDGNLDVIVGNDGQTNRLYLHNGTANPFSGVVGVDISSEVANTKGLALADMNRDGDLDVLVANDGQINRLFLARVAGRPFANHLTAAVSPLSEDTRGMALGDVDRDGDLDLVMAIAGSRNRCHFGGISAGSWSSTVNMQVGTRTDSTRCVVLTDVNDDGLLDVVFGNGDANNHVYLNNGTTTPFDQTSSSDFEFGQGRVGALSMDAGDVDGDGDMDLAIGALNSSSACFLNRQTSIPYDHNSAAWISGGPNVPYGTKLGDIDGDGDLDVVQSGMYTIGLTTPLGRLAWSSNDRSSTPFSGNTTLIDTDAGALRGLALGDVDRDGDLDIVVARSGASNRLYRNNGTATPFAGVTPLDIGSESDDTRTIELVDVDHDGKLDVVAGNVGSANLWYKNAGGTDPFSADGTEIVGGVHPTLALGIADFDHDGSIDLVTAERNESPFYHSRPEPVTQFDTSRRVAVSLSVDGEPGDIAEIVLDTDLTTPVHTAVDFSVTNNGGQNWYLTRPGRTFRFPTTGSDLRWKAALHSSSPVLTPVVRSVTLSYPMNPPTTRFGDALQCLGNLEHVLVPGAEDIRFAGSDSFSISMWLCPESAGTAWQMTGSTGTMYAGVGVKGNACARLVLGLTDGASQEISSNLPLPWGRYSHVAFAKSGGTVSVYINGALDSSYMVAAAILAAPVSDGDIYVGGNGPAMDDPFDGGIEEFRLWNTALSGNELRAWMHRQLDWTHPALPNLMLHYSFDDLDGLEVADGSGCGHTGTLLNSSGVLAASDLHTWPTRVNVPVIDRLVGSDIDGTSTTGLDWTPTFEIRSQGALGTVVLNSENAFTYTPATNTTGTDSFTYRVVDTRGVASVDQTVTIQISTDSDQDGMEDGWELDNGLNPDDMSDANDDPDHDGATNLDEFIALTNPNLATSFFKVDAITALPTGGYAVTVQSALNRVYTLQYRDDLTAGEWTDVPGQARVPGTGATMDMESLAGPDGHRFFRVTVALH